jgi:2-oxoglutarate dehydrogenase E1 component
MTPKSLLRLPAATSSVDQLTGGGFNPLIDDKDIKDSSSVERIVLCSGKVFYDLVEARKKSEEMRVSIVRLEQFYPFPTQHLREVIASYPNAKQLVWAQEEPKNMGGWTFVEPLLEKLISACERPIYVGRSPSASPATGSYAIHQAEQAALVQEALTI